MDTPAVKIGLMAGLLLAALGGFLALALARPTAQATPETPSPAPIAQARSAIVPLALPPPPQPHVNGAHYTASWHDPFSGGPKKPRIILEHNPPPPEVPVYATPAVAITPDRLPVPRVRADERPRALPPGRMAGWLAAENGRVYALVELDGQTRAVQVGDTVAGLRVRAIALDHVVLVDAVGGEVRLSLQAQGDGHVIEPEAWRAN